MKKLNVILMVGIPGSTKTSFIEHLPNDFVSLSQDHLGSRADVIFSMKRNLSQGKNVIIDRTNISRVQRKYFTDVAKDYGATISVVFLDFPVKDCINRIKERKVHETLPNSVGDTKIEEVVTKFAKSLEVPDYNEGLNEIFHITDFNSMPAFTESVKERIARGEPESN